MKSEISVQKRNGSLAPLDINKIKQVIHWASDGLDVNPLKLEAGVEGIFHQGIETRAIQNNLINKAVAMTSLEEPDWRYVAGRLVVMNLRKETILLRGYEYSPHNYLNHVAAMIGNGLYSSQLWEYSEEELREAGQWMNLDWDLDYDYAGACLLQSRYLMVGELPQEMYLTIALLLASKENLDKRMSFAYDFYCAIAQRKISLATPLLLNLRQPNGNLSSCFIMSVGDSIESIYNNLHRAARISQNAGGLGVDVSQIRAKGSWVRGTANASSGVLPWIKLYNDTAVAVNQQGRRAGAFTIALGIWHLDIEDFLEIQTEVGDIRKKSLDIFPQVIIPDAFMHRVVRDEDWYLTDPYEVKQVLGLSISEMWGAKFIMAYRLIEDAIADGRITLYKKVSAKKLFVKIMQTQIETGLPYIAFKDSINRYNPNSHEGTIPCVNLCTESFSVVHTDLAYHVCNLVSLNLGNISDDELEGFCQLSVRMLDNAIDLSKAPVAEADNHNYLYRVIGVGTLGLADWLALRNLTYRSTGTKETVSRLYEDIAYYCIKTSADLATERMPYMAFEHSSWDLGRMIGKSLFWFQENSYDFPRWKALQKQILNTGIRNSQVLAIAPNTSSALLQGATASILPPFSRMFVDKNSKGSVPLLPPYIKEHFWHYLENKSLDQKIIVDLVGTAIQPWVDTGVSMELLFNLNSPEVTAKYIMETLIDAWKKECKAIYYIRSIQKNTEAIDRSQECEMCAA
jgi:ribonucleoside-diphosphate reductase alpha chain